MKKTYLFNLAALLTVTGSFIIAGCSGGSGSSSSASVFSEEKVEDTITDIDSYFPGCTSKSTVLAAASGVVELADGPGPLYKVIKLMAQRGEPKISTAGYMPAYTQEISGDCGGSISYDYEHASGVSTSNFIFNNFCADDSANNGSATTLDGDLMYRVNGVPGDYGPVLSSTTTTANSLAVDSGGDVTSYSFSNLTYTYGTPSENPPAPTAANPDTITLTSASFQFGSLSKTHTLTNTNMTIVSAGEGIEMSINAGRYSSSSSGYMDISTTSPLIIDGNGDITDGTIVLAGQEGTITLDVQPGGDIDVSLDGEQMNQGVDCSDSLSSFGGIFGQLP